MEMNDGSVADNPNRVKVDSQMTLLVESLSLRVDNLKHINDRQEAFLRRMAYVPPKEAPIEDEKVKPITESHVEKLGKLMDDLSHELNILHEQTNLMEQLG